MKTKLPKIIVTSALPYANGSIHVGHLVEYIQTDMFVRFLKLAGEEAVYCCADDTHGAPIAIKADELKIKPEELIGKFAKEHLEDFKSFHIEFDSYYSTNSPENKHFSDLIFGRLKDKGYIYTKEIETTFCEHCKRSLPDRYVKGKCPRCGAEDQYGDVCEKCNSAYSTVDLVEPYCTICKNAPVRKDSKHYFFKLSAFSEQLNKWLTENKKLQPEIVNYVRNWIKEGLQDWDISRDGPYFGFNIPGEKDKFYYVWLDAPIGYISSYTNYIGNDVIKGEEGWNSSRIIHFIGKDIIYFHFLFWPAMLMASGFTLPETLVVHGFLTVNGEKMSKSRGTFFTAREFAQKYDPEHLRFYYAKVLSKKMSDIDLDFKDFQDSVNNELVSNIGNFCYRTLSFCNKYLDSKIGAIPKEKLIPEAEKLIENIHNAYFDANFNEAVKNILQLSTLGNKYFQANEPWKMIKEDKEKAGETITLCANLVKILSIVLKPILPEFSKRLQEQLGVKNLSWQDTKFNFKDTKINQAEILIDKLEIKEDETFPLDLKVAKILSAEAHPEADKLVVLQVDLNTEKRQIVAGIKNYYELSDLIEKKIVIVSNLKHAKLRGIESQGMLLAGEEGKKVSLLLSDAKVGSSLQFGTVKNNTAQVSFDDFLKVKMTVKDSKVYWDEKELKSVTVENISKGKVC
ncbi:MAG: methionine--tRNA ligase [Nanoarchaeota archaeon]|nr:methionine--tRNA ligase [Nanoarchaeota archaeon]MBU1703740.1 methionine--tRNA ligase [Nanoarchaeota archaeon]